MCGVPPLRALLYVSIVMVRPHASWLMERFSPDFCAMFFPGSSTVPLALLTMFRMSSALSLTPR